MNAGHNCRLRNLPDHAGPVIALPLLSTELNIQTRRHSYKDTRLRSMPQDMDRYYGFLDALQAAAVLLHGMAGARNLARAGLAAQLGHQFVELPDTGGAQWMAFGFQTA